MQVERQTSISNRKKRKKDHEEEVENKPNFLFNVRKPQIQWILAMSGLVFLNEDI